MKERFLADGNNQLWLDSTLQALEGSNFSNINYNPQSGQITAEKEGPITISINPTDDGQSSLEIESKSLQNLNDYKNHVAQAFSDLKDNPIYNQPIEEPAFGTVNTSELPLDDMDNVFEFSNYSNHNQSQEPTDRFNAQSSDSLPYINLDEERLSDVDLDNTLDNLNYNANSMDYDGISSTGTMAVPYPRSQPFYLTEWFTVLMLILLPPVGIFLLWHNELYPIKSRQLLTYFFAIYTLLWSWLLTMAILSLINGTSFIANESENAAYSEDISRDVDNYWNQESVVLFMEIIPDMYSDYEDLYNSGELQTSAGKVKAEDIYNKVEDVSDNVLKLSTLSQSNGAFYLQDKVNEAADAFLLAVNQSEDALKSGNNANIEQAYSYWEDAKSIFDQIDSVYDDSLTGDAGYGYSSGSSSSSNYEDNTTFDEDTTTQVPSVTPSISDDSTGSTDSGSSSGSSSGSGSSSSGSSSSGSSSSGTTTETVTTETTTTTTTTYYPETTTTVTEEWVTYEEQGDNSQEVPETPTDDTSYNESE